VALREGRKRKRKKMREVIMMLVSAGVKRRREEKKNERYLVHWGLFYFGAIFKLKLSCHLRIEYQKLDFAAHPY
jgi:hypothetical protein